MTSPVIEAKGLTKDYQVGKTSLNVLRGVDFTIDGGEIVAVVGESGAGKSTLLHILGMLDRPTAGRLSLMGEDITDKNDHDLAAYRNSTVGFVFQFHHLLPEFSALENVMMPARILGGDYDTMKKRAEKLIGQVGLSKRLEHRPNELSGGELQRIAVARALMNEPALVLADEPSGNLDHRNSVMLHDLLWDLARSHGHTFVIATHDMSLAGNADRVVHIYDGHIKNVKKADLRELFSF